MVELMKKVIFLFDELNDSTILSSSESNLKFFVEERSLQIKPMFFGKGEEKRDHIYIYDLVKIIIDILEKIFMEIILWLQEKLFHFMR